MNKKRNILPMVGACLLFVGLILAIPSYLLGSATGLRITPGGVALTGNRYLQRTNGDIGWIETEEEFSGVTDIYIDVNYADVRIETGQSSKVFLEYGTNAEIDMEVKQGTLRITQTTGFSISIINIEPLGDQADQAPSVVIWLPENTRLATVTIKNNSGKCDVSGFLANKLEIKNSYGPIAATNLQTDTLTLQGSSSSVKLAEITTETAKISNSYGDISLQNSTAKTLEISGSSSNIDLQNSQCETATLKTSFGDLAVDEFEANAFSFKGNSSKVVLQNSVLQQAKIDVDFGGITATNLETHQLSIEASSSEINLQGAFYGTTKVKCSFADVTVKSSLPQNSYGWKLNTSFGSITLDGNSIEGSAAQNPGGENSFDISTKSGSIQINWEK